MADPNIIHGTCIAIAGIGVLLRGPSGSGKSDLALRLMDGDGQLVADDQCVLQVDEQGVFASAPSTIAGLLEVRGVGIVQVQTVARAPIGLVIDLVAQADEPHLPPKGTPLPRVKLIGCGVPHLQLWPFAASAPAKVRLAVHALAHGQLVTDRAIKLD